MAESPLKHFLITYDADHVELVGVREFSDADEAVEAYSREEEAVRDRTGMQVVLIAADSLDTVKHTHPNYWGAGDWGRDQMIALARELCG